MERRTARRTPVRRQSRRPASSRVRRNARPGTTLSHRGRSRLAWSPTLLAAGLAVAVVLALAGLMVTRAQATACHATGDRIIWAEQETQEEGASQSPPPDLLTRADQLAACGEGQLVMLVGAGQGAVQAGPAAPRRARANPAFVDPYQLGVLHAPLTEPVPRWRRRDTWTVSGAILAVLAGLAVIAALVHGWG